MSCKINKKFGRGKIFSAAALAVAGSLSLAKTSFAAEKCGKTDTFFDWGCDPNAKEQITPVLIQIINWMAVGVTIVVIAGVVYGAIMYTTSGGSPEQSKKAIGIIRNAFIALIMYFAMWALLNWVVPGGIFG